VEHLAKYLMANKDCLLVSMKAKKGLATAKLLNNLHLNASQVSTEGSDVSPLPLLCSCDHFHSLYRKLSPLEETQAKALTCSLQEVLYTLDAELDVVNLRECKILCRSCPLQGVGSSPLMQRRSQRLSVKIV